MKYVIKSIKFNDYFVAVNQIKNNKYELFWSDKREDAYYFATKKEAQDSLVLIHGLIEEDMMLNVIGVEDED